MCPVSDWKCIAIHGKVLFSSVTIASSEQKNEIEKKINVAVLDVLDSAA